MDYKKLSKAYGKFKHSKENYFVSYAVRGSMVIPDYSLRSGMPSIYPDYNSPVIKPSPLSNQYIYSQPNQTTGIC
jgi:hypothetical protein